MADKRTKEELLEMLEEQIELLQLNAENFEQGRTVTTLQMATAIRVLFHDTNSSVSLIKQICDLDGVDKANFEMVTTKDVPDGAKLVLFGDGLYAMSIGSDGMTCVPKLSNATHTKLPFDLWWSENVIKNVSDGMEAPQWLTREDLIKLHANKEGGAHVDENKNKRISEIGTKEAFGWVSFVVDANGVQKEVDPIVDQKKATIRQICYEVLISLHNHFPELFKQELY